MIYLAKILSLRRVGFFALCGAGCLSLGWENVSAQGVAERAGTAEFQYLETLVSARPAGLAGAYTSLAQGEDAIGYNPAGLSRLERSQSVAGTMRYHFLDVASGNATYAFAGNHEMTYAVSASYINYGNIVEVDENDSATGRSNVPYSFNPSFTAARKISDRLRIGFTVKGLTEYLGDFEGSQLAWGWGADLGMLYQPNARNLGFGLALLNLGRQEQSQVSGGDGGLLPVSLKGGFFYYPLGWRQGKVVADVELPWHDAPLIGGALEYAYSPNFTVRGGTRFNWPETRYYFLKATGQQAGESGGGNALKLAGGFTLTTDKLALDYAAQYWLNLSWVHALTVRYALK